MRKFLFGLTCVMLVSILGQPMVYANTVLTTKGEDTLIMNNLIRDVDLILMEKEGGTLSFENEKLIAVIDNNFQQLKKMEYFSNMRKSEIFNDISNQIISFNAETDTSTYRSNSLASSSFPASTKYWWGYGYRFYSRAESRAYADSVSSTALIGATATAIKSVLFGPGAPFISGAGIVWGYYRITLAEDVRSNANYFERLALDVSWVAIYKLYSF